MTENDIIEAEVICSDLPNFDDIFHMRMVLKDYRAVKQQNAQFLAMWAQLATTLECIPEMEYVLKAIAELTTFKYGDKLRTIQVVDEDGEKMEGGLSIGDVVTMLDRTSYNRPFIIVQREDGRKWQLESSRFELA